MESKSTSNRRNFLKQAAVATAVPGLLTLSPTGLAASPSFACTKDPKDSILLADAANIPKSYRIRATLPTGIVIPPDKKANHPVLTVRGNPTSQKYLPLLADIEEDGTKYSGGINVRNFGGLLMISLDYVRLDKFWYPLCQLSEIMIKNNKGNDYKVRVIEDFDEEQLRIRDLPTAVKIDLSLLKTNPSIKWSNFGVDLGTSQVKEVIETGIFLGEVAIYLFSWFSDKDRVLPKGSTFCFKFTDLNSHLFDSEEKRTEFLKTRKA